MYRHLEVWKHDNGSDDKIKQSETVLSLETEYHTVNSLFRESTILRFHCFCINLQEYKMASTNDLFEFPVVQNCPKNKRVFKICEVVACYLTWILIPHIITFNKELMTVFAYFS